MNKEFAACEICGFNDHRVRAFEDYIDGESIEIVICDRCADEPVDDSY